jgi:hypothetical protein
MHLAYLWLCRASSSCAIAYTGHSSHTVSSYYSYFRQLTADSLDEHEHELEIGGPGIIVELDESKFGKKKKNTTEGIESRVCGYWVESNEQKDEKYF